MFCRKTDPAIFIKNKFFYLELSFFPKALVSFRAQYTAWPGRPRVHSSPREAMTRQALGHISKKMLAKIYD
jgi:hypothetical protein